MKMHASRRPRFVVAMVAGLVACGGPSPDRLKSYPTQTNASSGEWTQVDQWAAEVEWRLGGVAPVPEYIFSRDPLSLSLAANGHLIVIDPEGQSVRSYSPDGLYVRSIGRYGEGPGEWRYPIGASSDDAGNIWVVNFQNLQYTVYDSLGTYLKSLPRLPLGFHRIVRRGVFDTLGHYLDETATYLGPGRWDYAVARVDTADGTVIDSVLALPRPTVLAPEIAPGMWRAADPGAPPPPEMNLMGRLVVELRPDGAWIADSRRLTLFRIGLEGDTLLAIETSHRDGMQLTRAQQRIVREALLRTGQPEHESPYGREVVQAIHELNDGHLLVLIEEEVGRPGNRFDVFNPQGVFLGTIDVGVPIDPESVIASVGDTLYAVSVDEWEAKSIVRITLHRTP